jgi:hypothetical protein
MELVRGPATLDEPLAEVAELDLAADLRGRLLHLLVVHETERAQDEALQLIEPDALLTRFVDSPAQAEAQVDVEPPPANAQVSIEQLPEALSEAPVRIRPERFSWREDLTGEEAGDDQLEAFLLGRLKPRVFGEEVHDGQPLFRARSMRPEGTV